MSLVYPIKNATIIVFIAVNISAHHTAVIGCRIHLLTFVMRSVHPILRGLRWPESYA
jgi:hypothetical protein